MTDTGSDTMKQRTVLEWAVENNVPCPETTIKQLEAENARLRALLSDLVTDIETWNRAVESVIGRVATPGQWKSLENARNEVTP
jgi:hypothetical protein